jgi:hypothetical protein
MKLSPDIIGRIVEFSGDRVALWTLRNYIDPRLYNNLRLYKRRHLIYGEVQSGKTAGIIGAIQNPLYSGIHKIIILQNSLLVMSQYLSRLHSAGIDFQMVNRKTKRIEKDVILLMNNKSRYSQFLSLVNSAERPIQKYVLFMDESDSYNRGQHPLAAEAVHEYYVTATPFHRLYRSTGFFHTIHNVESSPHYKGLNNITIEYNDAPVITIVRQFYQDVHKRQDKGMMLINAFRKVKEMVNVGISLSKEFKEIVFVTLNCERRIIYDGVVHKLKPQPISELIDSLNQAKYVVFIANRMSLRGLSYCSSDYTRHLTHQYSDLTFGTVTNALQRMRLFGKYIDNNPIKLILPSSNQKMIDKMFENLDMKFDICREFS